MEAKELIAKQKHFFDSNATKDIDFRITQLKKLATVLKSNEEQLNKAIFLDFGKSEFENYISELSIIYHEISLAIKRIKKWSKRIKVKTNLANLPGKSYILPEPLGTTLIIGASNYPYQLSLVPVIASLAAGNTVILKPSEIPSETSKIMTSLINANFNDAYFHSIEGGVEITTELLQHQFDKIFFTGSTEVGRIIYQAAAKHLTPVTLELGGKSPTFVLEDANLKMTAKRLVWAKFLNAGQTCVAPDYILVQESIKDEFLEVLKNEIQKRYNLEESTDNFVKIINASNFERLSKLINPEKLYFGGEVNTQSRMIHPTILSNVQFDDEIMQNEIFGPILPVISFENLNEVILQVKQLPKPLSCYIYSKDKTKVRKIIHEVSFGGGAINDSVVQLSNSHLPFGGVGQSGMGSYHGKFGFDTFSHFKSILHKSFWIEPDIKYFPYSIKKLKLIKWLMR